MIKKLSCTDLVNTGDISCLKLIKSRVSVGEQNPRGQSDQIAQLVTGH